MSKEKKKTIIFTIVLAVFALALIVAFVFMELRENGVIGSSGSSEIIKEFNKNYNSKERLQINNNKLKSGSLEDIIEIIISLSNIKKLHSLNSSENQILLKAKKILTDEICLVKNISKNEAVDYIEDNFNFA